MEGIAPGRQTVNVDLLYATDREPTESDSPAKRYYDERRSDSLAVGSVTVRFGKEMAVG